jgi:hypothetical protein
LVPPPPAFYLALALIISFYLLLAETVKKWFYRRHAFRLEQVLVPKRKALYLSRNARLVQDTIATICLRQETEIVFDSLLEDLRNTVSYPVDLDQVLQSLQYLRRGGLISVDWNKRTVKREGSLREYVIKRVVGSEMWPNVVDDWLKISRAVKEKYGDVNPEYLDMISPRRQQ